MARKRSEMIEETRGRLITAARRAFATKGYADSAMEDFTAEVGLTRGALYHHFDGKRGLLEAVIAQIDAEMDERLRDIIDQADTPWDAFIGELIGYVKMAVEPEIQRIVLLDGPAVLGDPSRWPGQQTCVRTTKRMLEALMDEGTIREVDSEAMARLISGAALSAALWIADADDPPKASKRAVESLGLWLAGLRVSPPSS
ncbi:TetR/AcrR family transcriptional regulator [Mycolicibacterium sp. GCM10028919]|uniref:TetR/AcrR family transcriptional regulator n=1 Tax=Mycolicibacterium sp. GCM10028919 TaxID=3273401 RepID=UPI00361306E3